MEEEVLIVFIVFASMTAVGVVIGLVILFAKRLEHKQIMAAIEKGLPLSELVRPKPKPVGPRWIRYISSGIIVLFIAFGFLLREMVKVEILATSVLFGVAVSLITRALLYRKYYLKSQSANQNDTLPNKVSA